MDEQKKFMCFWGDGYRDANGNHILEFQNENFFYSGAGYSGEEILAITNLHVGQTYNNHAHGPYSHIITRVV